jgi:hypothetical protein
MGVLYSPSAPADEIREALANKDVGTVEFWTGIAVCAAIFFSVAALIANFSAQSVFSALSKENAPIILRSSLGYKTPCRLVFGFDCDLLFASHSFCSIRLRFYLGSMRLSYQVD